MSSALAGQGDVGPASDLSGEIAEREAFANQEEETVVAGERGAESAFEKRVENLKFFGHFY